MRLAVCSIQKNRGPWLIEWVTFHHLVGVTDFIIYLHECEDDSAEIVQKLSRIFRIKCFTVGDIDFAVQLKCFQHAYDEFGKDYNWLAFIDGDEFLFPTRETSLTGALSRFDSLAISALAVYWRCFGASGNIQEPKGLVTQNFRHCSTEDFDENRHIKSIVRSGAHASVQGNSHYFSTDQGTIDEKYRPIKAGFDANHVPSWHHIRINHYATQSREFYEKIKYNAGAADAGANTLRPESWWNKLDRNEVFDTSLEHLAAPLRESIDGVCMAIDVSQERLGGLPVHMAK